MNDNPYAPPAGDAERNAPANPLLAPAIVLIALACLTLMLLIGSLPGQIIRLRAIDTSTPAGQGEFAGGISALVGLFLMNVIVIAGSIDMLRLKNHRSALTAAIAAVVPACSPCFVLGIPFGIWAIVLLRKPMIKERFR